ncbi:hypothetical protein [Halobellus sp. EA9]|uniref:hypothetical protein n=1 Tax=Halobellus sp. EA9 TaxID=3421647 RepID=UPI003EBBCE47
MSDRSLETAAATSEPDTDAPLMVAVYRHDVHKLRGRGHEHAEPEVAGVRVNEPVPRNADRDAALLSRPRGEPEQTVDAHASPRRLSLLTGDPQLDPSSTDADAALEALVTPTDAEALHARWLSSAYAARFNESVFYPYTSLQYHTLLTAALLDNYRAGYAFDDLYVEVSPEQKITPHRTVLTTPHCAVRITGDPSGPAARLGSQPARSFGDVWAQLPAYPFDTGARKWRVLDAQLRRIRAWSTALQYIDEYTATYIATETAATTDSPAAGGGDDDADAAGDGEGEVGGGGWPGVEVMVGWAATLAESCWAGTDSRAVLGARGGVPGTGLRAPQCAWWCAAARCVTPIAPTRRGPSVRGAAALAHNPRRRATRGSGRRPRALRGAA